LPNDKKPPPIRGRLYRLLGNRLPTPQVVMFQVVRVFGWDSPQHLLALFLTPPDRTATIRSGTNGAVKVSLERRQLQGLRLCFD
jgi:hypothetical protein